MDGANNADSDHSLTWEDFYGSTTDLTPTLLGILNTFLDPSAPAEQPCGQPKLDKSTKRDEVKRKMEPLITSTPSKDPRLIAGGVKLPGLSSEESSPVKCSPSAVKKSPIKMSYVSRLKSFGLRKNSNSEVKDEASETKADDKKEFLRPESAEVLSKINTELIAKVESKKKGGGSSFENLSPTVKKMISGSENCAIPQPMRSNLSGVGRSSYRSKHSIIPLMGTTSKITQSSMEIDTEIYDKPANPTGALKSVQITSIPRSGPRFSTPTHSGLINRAKDWSESKVLTTFSPESPKKTEPSVYDTPVGTAIYDVPKATAISSLPYIDQDSVQKDDATVKSAPKVIELNNTSTVVSLNAADDGQVVQITRVPQVTILPHPKISGSTGDLKSQSNDDNRLNLPNVSVVRPLSMSSIASSTSTSSSGNQNKGGANSAYLASIESLDDHSDMDNGLSFGKNSRLTQINGSSMTVDSTDGVKNTESNQPGRPATPPRPRYCDPNLSQLQRVCTEIVDTENVYVEDLRQVVEGYLHYWKENEIFLPEQLNDLFSNIEEIYEFNRSFSQNLNECNLEAVAIAKCFVHHSSGFSIYTQYCTDYPGIMASLARLLGDTDSAQPFRTRQMILGHPLPLGSYLLKPVQRILKYHLLLQNLVKQHKSQDTEYALHKMTDIAHDINDMKRRHEHSVRVQEIQSLLYGWNGQDLTTFGELCAEGTFRVFGAKAMRHAFLFDKMLLLTKNKEYGMLAYKSHIMCNNLMLVESIQGQPLSFHVIPFDCPRMQVTLQARSIQHKREWTLLIKRNILENYNAVIPSHARQLVMELGQNKTDDDMLAEKSSTLMSHSSMRKQLGAPEYLEKRKLERERRKSFESGLRYKLKRTATRKGQSQINSADNEESEKEQVLKENNKNETSCNSHYLCSDCYMKNSDSYFCEDCDEPLVFDLIPVCKKDISQSNPNICDKCKPQVKKCNAHNELYICNKCDSDVDKENNEKLGKNATRNKNLKNSLLFPSNEKVASNDLCENCNNPISNKISIEKTKNIYDRLNDKSHQKSLDIKKTCLKCHKITENISMLEDKKTTNDLLSTCVHDDVNKSNANLTRRLSDSSLLNVELDLKEPINEDTARESEYSCRVCNKKGITCKNCGVSVPLNNKMSHNNSEQGLNYIKCNCRKLDEERPCSPRSRRLDPSKSLEIKVYTAKTVPKKISKIKKNRAKTLRHLAVDPTAKFYTDISNDLHISESTDSINTINANFTEQDVSKKDSENKNEIPTDMDEETYKSLIQKTDSFKKSEMEKDKLVIQTKQMAENQIKPSNISSDDKILQCNLDSMGEIDDENFESCDDGHSEKPLEQIISQLLMQNREFQKILKRHQFRNANNRRNQRLLKSHSNPEKIFAQNRENQNKYRIKYGRQLSADETNTNKSPDELDAENVSSTIEQIDIQKKDEPIYETLVIEPKDTQEDKITDNKIETHDLNNINEQSDSGPINISRNSITESDYVYLCFDGKKNIDAYKVPVNMSNNNVDDNIYAIPNCIPRKVHEDVQIRQDTEKVVMEDDCYENTSEIWKRISKDTVIENKSYVFKSNDNSEIEPSQSPNLPKIWLNRQKEHFGVPREKKSGSLPRSFQVVLNEDDLKNNTKCMVLNKMYLNKEGKVIQTDRPFTIASDHSEISYEDIERFIKTNDESGLTFPQKDKMDKSYSSFMDNDNIDEIFDSVTRSTLELEAEIDRCYTNRFGAKQNQLKNMNVSQIKIADSISSSMEVINDKLECETSQEDINTSVHPEHKIYKTTNSNILSFKSVLNRFKSKNKATPEQMQAEEIAEQKSPQRKTSPKNLLQRLKSIKNDDQNEEPQKDFKNKNSPLVMVTDTSVKNMESIMSKSFCNNSTTSLNLESEVVSKSCNNISLVKDKGKPAIPSPSSFLLMNKTTRSIQEINKLPTYKQGSRLLGARIAQSDYADPRLIFAGSNSDLQKVNMFINKNSLRPDSVLSNSSHFTSSSDGCFNSNVENGIKNNHDNNHISKPSENISNMPIRSDESFYEKSFEEIEKMFNSDEIFRDSAIYSDDGNNFGNEYDLKLTPTITNVFKPIVKDNNIRSIDKPKTMNIGMMLKKPEIRVENSYTVVTSSVGNIKTIQENKEIKFLQTSSNVDAKEIKTESIFQTKIAPPIPTKPVMSKIVNKWQMSKNITLNTSMSKTITPEEGFKITNSSSTEKNKLIDIKLLKSNLPLTIQLDEKYVEESSNNCEPLTPLSPTIEKLKGGIPRPNFNRSTSSNISMKRMSFERCSLDSSTISRRSKSVSSYKVDTGNRTDDIVITKSVQERKKEIEMNENCSGECPAYTQHNRKSLDSLESISTSLSRSYSLKAPSKQLIGATLKTTIQKCNIPVRNSSIEDEKVESGQASPESGIDNDMAKGSSWVKQVVNRFQ